MRTKLGNIVSSQGSLVKLIGGEYEGQPISGPVCTPQMAYTLSLLRKEAVTQIEFFETQRAPIMKRFGEVAAENAVKEDDTDEAKASKVGVVAEARAEAEQAMVELLDVDVTMPTVGRIKLSRLEAEKITLGPNDYLALEWLIKPDLAAVFENEE